MTRTEWYSCKIKPVRVGWYEWAASARCDRATSVHWWDGRLWMWHETAETGFIGQSYGFWRGVTK